MSAPDLIFSMTFKGVEELCRQAGIDCVDAAAQAGLPLVALEDRSLMVSASATMDFLNLVGSRTEASGFGLLLAQGRVLADYGVAGLAARDQPDVRRFLEILAKSCVLRFRRCHARLVDLGDVHELQLTMGGYPPAQIAQMSELAVGALVRFLKDLLGEQWAPAYVTFRHPAPASRKLHRQLLGVDPIFGHDYVAMGVESRTVHASLPSANSDFRAMVESLVDEQVALVADDLSVLVSLNLPGLIQNGEYAASQVAAALGLTPKALQKRLAAEETSLPKIVERVRSSLARELVEESQLPLVEVSTRLGFGSQVAFAHWHKAKYGVSALHRRKARSLAGAMMDADAWG